MLPNSLRLFMIVMFIPGIMLGQDELNGEAFRFFRDAYLEHDSAGQKSYAIVQGDFLVFEYVSDNAREPGNGSIAESRVAFQVEPRAKTFKLKDDEIRNHRGIYIQLCRCADRGIQLVERGTIMGKKSGEDTWDVTLDIHVTGRRTGKVYHIQEEATYRFAER